MRRILVTLLLVSLTTEIGCSSRSASSPDAGAAPAAAKAIPADSPLAKIQPGMTMSQVIEALGQPTDRNNYMTGKAWIPFYYGGDKREEAWHYKGQGRVVFKGGNEFGGDSGTVLYVDYDPSDSGFRR